MDMQTISLISDKFYSDSDIVPSMESIVKSGVVAINDHNDLMKLFHTVSDLNKSPKIEPTKFIIPSDNVDEYILNINMALLETFSYGIGIDNGQAKSQFIRQLSDMKETDTLYVFTDLVFDDINLSMLMDGIFICNLIRDTKCTKLYMMNKLIGMVDLFFGATCNDVVVGDLAALSITDAHNASSLPRFLINSFNSIVKDTFNYWTDKKLITSEERLGIMSNETQFSIFLLCPEIKRRLGKLGE